MNLKVLVLPGDGIGTEVTHEAVRVMRVVAEKWGHTLNICEGLLGGIAIHKTGTPLPAETERLSAEADAVLMGWVHRRRYTTAACWLRRASSAISSSIRPFLLSASAVISV